ncbi:MAG: hypothetical protein IAE98_05405 [Candidatus Kapabacteria bacterium]|nr:hypothetical protein [Candidatus Kapabacteria bacterium]
MRTEFIKTKVRPIKKLFIIETNDYDAFAKLFSEIQDEIDVIQNLIFVNDSDLWSPPNKEFVKRSDPDIILNLSNLDDNKLSIHFGIFSVKPITDYFKIPRFGTNLLSFSNRPSFLDMFGSQRDEPIEVLSALELDNTSESLLSCLNYGLAPKTLKKRLGLSIFKKLKPTYLSNRKEIIDSIFQHDKKFSHLTADLGGFAGSGYGTSVYEVDYNSEGLFNGKKKYFFVSEKNDFKTITYFWNTRSYYPYSNNAWIPIEYLKEIETLIDDETTFVCFNKKIEKKILKVFPSAKIIQPTRLHFKSRNERWSFFEHNQTISITDNEAIIQHPAEKGFAGMGAFILEVRGLKEFIFPKRRNIGKLFFSKGHDHALFADRFQRISELGLSKYVLEISPLKAEDVTEEIVLPSFKEMAQHIFEDVGYTIQSTHKSSILEQAVNLLGGVNELSTISGKHIFELLVGLTPKVRTERIVNKILDDAKGKLTSENVLDIIAEVRERGAVSFPSVTLSVEEILNRTSLSTTERKTLLPQLQKLYDQKILLRGKSFQCPFCSSNLWIQIDAINRTNHCVECNNEVNLPIYKGEKQDSDYFRLNQLFVRAVDQGQLSTLLLLHLFFQQKFRGFEYLSNIEVLKEGHLITDIDLLIKIWRKIGVAECKSTSGFSEKQVDELIKIASSMQCDFIAFSSLVDSTSQEVKDLVEILNKKSLEIPAFIFTNQSLFNPKSNMIQKHFELWHRTDFSKGPILVS